MIQGFFGFTAVIFLALISIGFTLPVNKRQERTTPKFIEYPPNATKEQRARVDALNGFVSPLQLISGRQDGGGGIFQTLFSTGKANDYKLSGFFGRGLLGAQNVKPRVHYPISDEGNIYDDEDEDFDIDEYFAKLGKY